MATAVELQRDIDRTDVPHIVRTSVQLGLLECLFVVLMSFVSRFLAGPVETVLLALLLIVGLALVSGLPGIWTRARTIEGIAGAAGIGLGATAVYLLVDVALLQPLGIVMRDDAERPELVLDSGGLGRRHLKSEHRFELPAGIKTIDVVDSKFASGPLALQWGRGVIKFRKVEIRPL